MIVLSIIRDCLDALLHPSARYDALTRARHRAFMLYAPAPQTVYDESRPAERLFAPASPQPVPEQSVEERLTKELRFDPDAWIVETEDRAGRHFLELAMS